MRFEIQAVQAQGVQVNELYSHTKLESALHIYRSFGFTDMALPRICDRANVRMRLSLVNDKIS